MKPPMTIRIAVGIGLASLFIYGVLLVTFFVLPLINPEFQRFEYWRESILIPAYAIVGLLITTRRPGHLIGWLFTLAAFAAAIQEAAGQYAVISLTTQNNHTLGGNWAAWISELAQFVTLSSFLFLFLLFPTGRILSRRWSPVAWSLTAGVAAQMIFRAFHVGELEVYPIPNPAGLPVFTGVLAVIINIGGPLLIFGFFGTVAMLVVRTYSSRGVERQQIKWFVFTAVLVISLILGGGALTNLLATALPPVLSDPLVAVINSIWILGPISLATVTALAILRYRLFDIDVIIRRTLQYSLISSLLVLTYLGSIILLQSVFHALTGEISQLAIVISTLVIAALFNPLRMRIRDLIDRRFYRQKYNADQALAHFAAVARDEVEMENLSVELIKVAKETMQPRGVSLWISNSKRGGR